MNLYIWEDTSPVSGAYHDGGGIVIVAESLDAARKLWDSHASDEDDYIFVRDAHKATEPPPDVAYHLAGVNEPRVFAFPDSGCC